jgi:putative flavoprotein involved in K+ transport
MNDERTTERVQTVVIGGGQSGLAVGASVARRGLPFVILEANDRIGDSWRRRYDSLRLFTPARYDVLDGLPFPAEPFSFPTKDDMADYLETYAKHFALPIRTGVTVTRLTREGMRYIVETSRGRFVADHVVVAMATYEAPKLPEFARALDPGIVQMHSNHYRNASQLQPGDVLVVGAGNSGADIALDAVRSHRVWLSGLHPGHVPFRIESRIARLAVPFVFRVVFHRILTVDNPLGRRVRRALLSKGEPLIRVKPQDLTAAGVARVPRVTGVRDGKPLLDDGRTLDAANVIWCTGYRPDLSWIDVPGMRQTANGDPHHERGVVPDEPGLYFIGLRFLHALSSTMIQGVSRDADRIARAIATRIAATQPATAPADVPARA